MSQAQQTVSGGQFLTTDVGPTDVFTREDLTHEQRLFGQAAAEFMRGEVLPNASQLYAHDWQLTRRLLRKAAELDLLRLEIHEAYGGLALDKISAAYVAEQIAVNPSFGGTLGAHTAIGTLPLVYYGTEAQKARYLPRLASGELIGACALTEPQSGSDALAVRTQATMYARERRQFGRAIAEFGLIRHKLAELSIRCYVGDAMVYRAIGDVDRALDALQPDDTGAVLKTIEGFAVECSINKVFTSEALAYVVDEALQVFGGNGYSREFPAERAYRDARIMRIYEGTNEINRLLIPTRLLKQLRLREPALMVPSALRPTDGEVLGAERALLRGAKQLVIRTLAEAAAAYPDSLKEEQEVLGYIANLVIEIYAIESALARTEKLHAARGADAAAVAVDVSRVYVCDAADRMVHSAKQVARALLALGRGAALADLSAPLGAFAGVDTIAARRRIADTVVAAGRHPF